MALFDWDTLIIPPKSKKGDDIMENSEAHALAYLNQLLETNNITTPSTFSYGVANVSLVHTSFLSTYVTREHAFIITTSITKKGNIKVEDVRFSCQYGKESPYLVERFIGSLISSVTESLYPKLELQIDAHWNDLARELNWLIQSTTNLNLELLAGDEFSIDRDSDDRGVWLVLTSELLQSRILLIPSEEREGYFRPIGEINVIADTAALKLHVMRALINRFTVYRHESQQKEKLK